MELYQLIDKAPEKENNKNKHYLYCANWGDTICALYSS